MNAPGGWSREAARFALCGTEADIHAWIDTDRQLAQHQDDRETALYLARISTPDVADAATEAVESAAPDAATTFLSTGVVEASATDNRVMITRILASGPGSAVRRAANDALDAGTARALHEFVSAAYEAAQQEDDAVATAAVIASAGPYTKAHAQAAMEGPAWMRRRFLATVQYKTAQLDHDSAAHIAAIQGAIAAAMKIAHKAQEDAARAQEAAARARNAASEALEWADKAKKSATQAAHYAQQADANADAADKSARDAQASADKAKQAAATARTAARTANHSANRAMDAARRSVASANSAQESATSARASAIQAGKDARTAAVAASQAHQIAAAKRKAEIAAAMRKAAEDARRARASGQNPADTPDNDDFDDLVPQWKLEARRYADAFNAFSILTGLAAAGLGVASLFLPIAPVTAPLAVGFGIASLIFTGANVVFTGLGYGWTSRKFFTSLAGGGLALLTFGQSKWIGAMGGSRAVTKVSQFGHDLISPVTSWLTF
ncbi:ALF repeat-containing protein [Streptomyces sp. AN091965]|nr:ALF repeat-containing protein [Streptomyces sp. AN091965]